MQFLVRLEVLDQPWEVWEVQPGEVPDMGETDNGQTDPEALRVYIRAGLLPARFVDTYAHELTHVLLDVFGLGQWLENLAPERTELAEEFVRLFTPALLVTWGAAGLIKDVSYEDLARRGRGNRRFGKRRVQRTGKRAKA